LSGRVWRFGDGVDTDMLAPGAYMKGPAEELATHCLEALDPSFAQNVRPGDFLVAGRNFGAGSSREQAAQVLVMLGVRAVIARAFAGIFYRNAFNLGLPALICEAAGTIQAGQSIEIDLRRSTLTVLETGETLPFEPVPENLLAIVEAGGLIPALRREIGSKQ